MVEVLTSNDKLIQENLFSVMERIEVATRQVGRNPQSVKLVVVTKTQPLDLVEIVIAAGAKHLGENYADEALLKIDALRKYTQVQWHMIGHVQSRKAETVSKNFNYVHSLGSLKLAERFNRFAGEMHRKLPVFLQFNVSGEETKSGWDAWQEQHWQQLIPDLEEITALEHLQIQGIMTMPPYTENPEYVRPYFRRLVHLRDFLVSHFPRASWDELSMGMSGDFEVAIQEGATWVRIGQAIFGPRICKV